MRKSPISFPSCNNLSLSFAPGAPTRYLLSHCPSQPLSLSHSHAHTLHFLCGCPSFLLYFLYPQLAAIVQLGFLPLAPIPPINCIFLLITSQHLSLKIIMITIIIYSIIMYQQYFHIAYYNTTAYMCVNSGKFTFA